MPRYTLHGLSLEIERRDATLDSLLRDLSCEPSADDGTPPSLRIEVRPAEKSPGIDGAAHEVFRSDGLVGLRATGGFYLTDGSSYLRFEAGDTRATAALASDFGARPRLLQQRFWSFGLVKLLRARGRYALHAACVVTPDGEGLLLVGPSGSGKSTLASEFVLAGWRFVGDDAVLLHTGRDGVEALAFRKPFGVFDDTADQLSLRGEGVYLADKSPSRKRWIDMEMLYPDQCVRACRPAHILFPRIQHTPQSVLDPVDATNALGPLLEQSGPQLFDSQTMPDHLRLLRVLLTQCRCNVLESGLDIHHDSASLENLMLGLTAGY